RARKVLSSRVSGPGRYALFAERGRQGTEGGLAALALVPRVFSPGGRFGSRDLAISFTLGRPAPIAIRVYSRSGRLVRTLADGELMSPGSNVVRWDGRDGDGKLASDGLYLISVGARGETHSLSVALVR